MNKLHSLVLLILLFFSCLSSVISFEKNDNYEDYPGPQTFKNNQKTEESQVPVTYSAARIQKELSELKQDYTVQNWPTKLTKLKLGAISAVALDVYSNVVIFHRAERVWSLETFDTANVFKQRNLGPIMQATIISFDRETGSKMGSDWGNNFFYMPHGLSIAGDYYYVTDVALHQVFRFNIKNSTTKPELILGKAFQPGKSANMFCKPTSVASLENGDFFVADGYCNSRIVKFNFLGEKILEWGKNTFSGSNRHPVEPPNAFAVPHALTLIPEKRQICVADRENGRVQCFETADGKFVAQYHSPIVGDRLFSVDYANGSFFVINGPEFRTEVIQVGGFIFDQGSGEVVSKFGSFVDPHDLAVTADGKEIYVADLSPDKNGHRIHKFMLNGLKPRITSAGDPSNFKLSVHRGDTALLVGSIVLFFSIFTIGIAILISRKKRGGNEENEYHSLVTK